MYTAPDVSTFEAIAEDHQGFDAVLLTTGETDTLCKVRRDRYAVLMRDLNRKAAEVREYQLRVLHLAAVNSGGIDNAINNLLA